MTRLSHTIATWWVISHSQTSGELRSSNNHFNNYNSLLPEEVIRLWRWWNFERFSWPNLAYSLGLYKNGLKPQHFFVCITQHYRKIYHWFTNDGFLANTGRWPDAGLISSPLIWKCEPDTLWSVRYTLLYPWLKLFTCTGIYFVM